MQLVLNGIKSVSSTSPSGVLRHKNESVCTSFPVKFLLFATKMHNSWFITPGEEGEKIHIFAYFIFPYFCMFDKSNIPVCICWSSSLQKSGDNKYGTHLCLRERFSIDIFYHSWLREKLILQQGLIPCEKILLYYRVMNGREVKNSTRLIKLHQKKFPKTLHHRAEYPEMFYLQFILIED